MRGTTWPTHWPTPNARAQKIRTSLHYSPSLAQCAFIAAATTKSSIVHLDRIGAKIFLAHWFEQPNCKQRGRYIERNHDAKYRHPAPPGFMHTGCKRTTEDGTYALRHIEKAVIRSGMLFAEG